MPGILNLATKQRDALTMQEQQARLVLAAEYGRAYRAIQSDLADVERLIATAGDHRSRVWLQQQRTYKKLMQGINAAFGDYGTFVEGNILQQQTRAAAQALTDSAALLKAGKVKPASFKHDWITNLIAGMQKRITRLNLPKAIPAAVTEKVKASINKALFSTQKLVDTTRTALGGVLSRVMGIHQTETMHAYRLVGNEVCKASGVQHWQWAARLNKRPAPCAMCCAMHGKVFDITVPFGTHPHCYCIAVPVIGNVLPIQQSGTDWFTQQNEAVQRDILGTKYTAFSDGKITLEDTIGYKVHPEYGVVRWERSARALGV